MSIHDFLAFFYRFEFESIIITENSSNSFGNIKIKADLLEEVPALHTGRIDSRLWRTEDVTG